jgi:enterochelin esterase-like enzyme
VTGPDPADPAPVADPPDGSPTRWTRRRLLTHGLGGIGVVAVAGAVGLELVAHGVLPGQQTLDRYDGACDVTAPPLRFATPGPSSSGTFWSPARNRTVGYTVAYPPGHGPGDSLPLVVMLHGYGGNHTNAVVGMSPVQALALEVDGVALRPMAMVTVDGGGGYWNPHPGDDPMAMVLDELLPRMGRQGLGMPDHRVGAMGISMGGYGALLLAEKAPDRIGGVAAISPAIWTSYDEAQRANPGAYASAADFAADDAVTHAGALASTPVRVASGNADPFHAGVEALAAALPAHAIVAFSSGCHTGPFFTAQEGPSLAFLDRTIGGSAVPAIPVTPHS